MGNENEMQPIRQSVHVDCPVEEAFRLFTERFGQWWPGDDSERDAVGEGSIATWDPPRRIEFTWQRPDDERVTVEFDTEADGTRVTLTHRGWEHSGVAVCISRFAGFVSEQVLAAV